VSSRLERLVAGLEEQLLVTNLVNVRYLTGFESSNAALLVEPGGRARLFTDSRYVEAAKAVEGVELVPTRRPTRPTRPSPPATRSSCPGRASYRRCAP